MPDLPEREGERPALIQFENLHATVDYIARFERNNSDLDIGVLTPTKSLQKKFINRLEGKTTNPVQSYRAGEKQKVDFAQPGIRVINYQSAKGLEFDAVFLPELQELTDDLAAPGVKMRFYVLLSRARTQLFLSYSGAEGPRDHRTLPRSNGRKTKGRTLMAAGGTLFSEQPVPLLIPTNRFNLLEMLSSRMIAPRAAYTKYYADLLDAAPGRVPIVPGRSDRTSSTPFRARRRLRSGRGRTRPGPAGIAPVDAWTAEAGTTTLSLGDPALGWAPRTIVPFTAVKAIHFRSDNELDEHQLRQHENIRQDVPYSVSPGAVRERPSRTWWLAR